MSSDVVVVDDDPRIRMLMCSMLEAEGFSVRGYESALPALDLVLAHPPHVLLTDLHMPELDGAGLAAAVRGGLGARSPRIILLTGCPESLRAKDRALFDRVLAKPWERDDLLRSIRAWVPRRHPRYAAVG